MIDGDGARFHRAAGELPLTIEDERAAVEEGVDAAVSGSLSSDVANQR